MIEPLVLVYIKIYIVESGNRCPPLVAGVFVLKLKNLETGPRGFEI